MPTPRVPKLRLRLLARRLRAQRRLLALLAVVAVVSGGAVWGTGVALHWMESPQFCGACHTMKPELLAYEHSSHRSVECGECHVGRGAMDLVRAKLQGAVQMVRLVTRTYERPIPPAGPEMKGAAARCRECHLEAPANQDRLVIRRHYEQDEQSTEGLTALVVRVASQSGDGTRGVHWHVNSLVEYLPNEDGGVDYVRVEQPNGEVKLYLSLARARSIVASPQADDGEPLAELRTMDCLTCHNRAGHEFLSPGRLLDEALARGRLDRDLPYIKKMGMTLLTGNYSSTDEALAAIDGLESYYAESYPEIYVINLGEVQDAVLALREMYPLVASPEMGFTYRAYPSMLGHQDAPGCFRCHSGALVQVDEDGAIIGPSIPSACSTCHTFPERGSSVVQVMAGTPPAIHNNRLWMLDHADVAAADPAYCAGCHSRSYCDSCHATGVTHKKMLFEHADVFRSQGGETCAYCHREPSCAVCHEDDVLPDG